ncbi:MAG: AAA family ATPase [Lysobacterales bacterium]
MNKQQEAAAAMLTPDVVSKLDVQESLEIVATLGDSFISTLRELHAPPIGLKTLRRYRIQEAAREVGRSVSWLRSQESEGNFPGPSDRSAGGRRMYTLEEINAIRAYAGTLPKTPARRPYVLGFVNFKGGSSKTTCTYLASHFLASRGYRVLLVDLDPQGSLTASFEVSRGGEPVRGIDWEQTIGPILTGEIDDPLTLVHQTHWPTIDIIPASVDVYDAEMLLAVETARTGIQDNPFWRRLDTAMRRLDQYDFVLLDSAPALNLAAINAVVASDGLVIPVPPRNLDLEAAVKFAKVVHAWTERLPGFNDRKRWLRLLLTQLQKGSLSDQTHALLASRFFGSLIFNNHFPMSEAVRRGSAGAPSCYEGSNQVDRSQAEANRRVREALDEVFEEMLGMIDLKRGTKA